MTSLSALQKEAKGGGSILPFAPALKRDAEWDRQAKDYERLLQDDIDFHRDLIESPAHEVVNHVRRSFESARANRMAAGIDTRISEAMRMRKGEYSPHEKTLLGGVGTAVWYPLVDRQCRTMVAVLRNILSEDAEHPLWSLDPTPDPDLPPEVVERLADASLQKIELGMSQGLISAKEDVDDIIDDIRDDYQESQRLISRALATNVERHIRDHLVEAGFSQVLDAGLDDFVTFPTAFLRVKEVQRNKFVYSKRGKPASASAVNYLSPETVDPANIYPSADSTTTQDGSYIIEKSRASRSQLVEYKSLDGYYSKGIEAVLTKFNTTCRDWTRADLDKDAGMVNAWRDDEFIDVIMYHGKVRGTLLKDVDIDTFKGSEVEEHHSYEVVIYIVGDEIIRIGWVEDSNYERPYHSASLFPLPGSFWGRAIPDILCDMQRVANAALRSLVRNMGYTSAPITIIDNALVDLQAGKPVTGVFPGQTIQVNSLRSPSNKTNAPVTMLDVPSHSREYLDTLANINEMAESAVGLPRYMLGQPATGGAARTATGFAQLQTNASTVLKSSVVNLDHGWFAPVIAQLYRRVVTTTEDPNLKADASVRPRGATSMMAREMNKQRLHEALNLLMPFSESGHIPKEGVIYLLSEIVSELGLDVDRFGFDKALQQDDAALQQGLAAAGGVAGGPSGATQ